MLECQRVSLRCEVLSLGDLFPRRRSSDNIRALRTFSSPDTAIQSQWRQRRPQRGDNSCSGSSGSYTRRSPGLANVQSAPREVVHHHEIFTPDHPPHQTSPSWHHAVVKPHLPTLCTNHTYQTQKSCESSHWPIRGYPPEK